MLDPHRGTEYKHCERLLDLQRIIRWKLRIVLRSAIRGATIVLGMGNRRSMLDPHRHTWNKHGKSLLDLPTNMRQRVMNELSLGNCRGCRIVLSLGTCRSMLNPYRRTRNKHWGSLLDLGRNMRRRVTNELSLGNLPGEEDCSVLGHSPREVVPFGLALEHFGQLGHRSVQLLQYSTHTELER